MTTIRINALYLDSAHASSKHVWTFVSATLHAGWSSSFTRYPYCDAMLRMYDTTCSDFYILRDITVKLVTPCATVLFRTTFRSLLAVLKTRCAAAVSFSRMIMEYAHVEYCDMLLIDACNSATGAAARQFALVIQTPVRLVDCSSVSMRRRLHETLSYELR